MAFVKEWTPKIGDKVKTTIKLEMFGGYLEKGSIVTIIGKSNRGYDIIDNEGNELIECGWNFFCKPKEDEIVDEPFNAKTKIDIIVAEIKDWFDKNGSKANAVIGISGGKDSTVAAALLVKALGKDRVYGVLMPNGKQADIEDSIKVVEYLGINHTVFNIKNIYKAFEDEMQFVFNKKSREEGLPRDTAINLPPRIRMSVLYAIAQSFPNGGRVINTCNKSEDFVGYSTKYGDGAGDMSVLGNLLVSEIIAIGDELGLPYELVHKAPSDGLCGQTDEDRFGFTYNDIETYIKNGTCGNIEIDKKIKYMHDTSRHKYVEMYVC